MALMMMTTALLATFSGVAALDMAPDHTKLLTTANFNDWIKETVKTIVFTPLPRSSCVHCCRLCARWLCTRITEATAVAPAGVGRRVPVWESRSAYSSVAISRQVDADKTAFVRFIASEG